jgi:CheY-like chemotaxis protein
MFSSQATPRKPRRHLPLYLLAALNLIAIVSGLVLGGRIATTCRNSVDLNETSARRVGQFAQLGRMAAAVNAPGNDVFASRDFPGEAAALDRARAEFQKQLAEVRGETANGMDAEAARMILAEVADAEAQVEAMAVQAQSVFDHLRADRNELAEREIFAMDRSLASALVSLNRAEDRARSIQAAGFERQRRDVESLQNAEVGLAAILVVLVIGMAAFGWMLSRNAAGVGLTEEGGRRKAESGQTAPSLNPQLSTLNSPAEAGSFRHGADAAPSLPDGCRVLVADDGHDHRRLISFAIKKAGGDATVVENGQLALDAALAATEDGAPFDVVLMDMQMPVMDGYEATALLRARGYWRPIIALTANSTAGDRQKCLSAGCDDFATKPVDRRRLIAQVGAHVGVSQECLVAPV